MLPSPLQCVFSALLVFGTGLTLVAWLTPGWRHFRFEVKTHDALMALPSQPSVGLLTYACDDRYSVLEKDETADSVRKDRSERETSGGEEAKQGKLATPGGEMSKQEQEQKLKQDAWKYCRMWYQKKPPDWEKIVMVGFALGIAAQFAALLWSLFVCFWCFCEDCLIAPLPIFTGVSTLCLASALVIFWQNNRARDDVGDLPPASVDALHVQSSDFGASVWLGVLACAVMLLATISGAAYASRARGVK